MRTRVSRARPRWLPAAVCAAALAAPACETPAVLGPSLTDGTRRVVSLRIEGSTAMTAIGETRQLAAIAGFHDGTSREVTHESEWRSLTPSVIAVSPAGLATVLGFGDGRVQAAYGSATSLAVLISAWPPGRFSVSGRVREPGSGSIGGVRVTDAATGQSVLTAGAGQFSLGGIAGPELRFEKDGYETASHAVAAHDDLDVPIQRVIRVAAGGTTGIVQLAPRDLTYTVGGDRCFPCRMVRIVTPAAGTLRIGLDGGHADVPLYLWAAGRRFSAPPADQSIELPVEGGEIVVYVGGQRPAPPLGQEYVPFTLSTSME